jgi:hypothetical protein
VYPSMHRSASPPATSVTGRASPTGGIGTLDRLPCRRPCHHLVSSLPGTLPGRPDLALPGKSWESKNRGHGSRIDRRQLRRRRVAREGQPGTTTTTLTLGIPCGQVLLAGRIAGPDANEFEVRAAVRSAVYGILSKSLLDRHFRALGYRMLITLHDDGT